MAVKKTKILKDLVDKFNFTEVSEALLELYPDQKQNIRGYKITWDELEHLHPSKEISDMSIKITKVKDTYDNTSYYSTHGVTKNKKETYALDFSSFKDWLGFKIHPSTLKRMKQLNIMAHCLWEMTFNGFASSEIAKQRNRLKSIVKKIDKENKRKK
jgi:hypothetical protein